MLLVRQSWTNFRQRLLVLVHLSEEVSSHSNGSSSVCSVLKYAPRYEKEVEGDPDLKLVMFSLWYKFFRS
jgi:hypothetical protein